MSKRGLSAEEKATRTIAFFHETKSYFTMKELQKVLAKEKGIVAMTIEEVVKGLVDEGLVRSEKIGTVNLYWSFPSQAAAAASSALKKAEKEHAELENQASTLHQAAENASQGRENSRERTVALEGLAAKEAEAKELEAQVSKFSSCSAEDVAKKRNHTALFKAAAAIWTDNISIVEKYCRDHYDLAKSQFRAMHELSDDYEDLE